MAACYQAAARSDTSEPIARTVSGRSSRRPSQRCSGRQCLLPAIACSTQIRCEDWAWRACSQAAVTSGAASLPGFFGGTLFLGTFYFAVVTLRRFGAAPHHMLDPEMRRLRPFLFAAVAAYATGLMTLSNSYIEPTYAILGLVTARLHDPQGNTFRGARPDPWHLP